MIHKPLIFLKQFVLNVMVKIFQSLLVHGDRYILLYFFVKTILSKSSLKITWTYVFRINLNGWTSSYLPTYNVPMWCIYLFSPVLRWTFMLTLPGWIPVSDIKPWNNNFFFVPEKFSVPAGFWNKRLEAMTIYK